MQDAASMSEALRRFLASEVFLNRDPASIGDDDDLVRLGLDSLSVLRIVLFVETNFGVDLDGEDVLGDRLSTVRRIAEHCATRA